MTLPHWNPSWVYRVIYLLLGTGTMIATTALSGSIPVGLVAAGGCALCATCAALATEWDHRGAIPPAQSLMP